MYKKCNKFCLFIFHQFFIQLKLIFSVENEREFLKLYMWYSKYDSGFSLWDPADDLDGTSARLQPSTMCELCVPVIIILGTYKGRL